MREKTAYKIVEGRLKERGHWEDFEVNERMVLTSSGKN
jgi:hypothetical protein